MKINLLPQRRDDILAITRMSDVLTINGETFDFTQLAEGDVLPAEAITSDWFVGQVTRSGGELEVTLILPLPINYSHAQAFPAPITMTTDGAVALPLPIPVPVLEGLDE